MFLIAGYLIYGRIVEKNFGPGTQTSPAFRLQDNVDFAPLPTWKVFLIQLLNIAGTGPIFGALSGALFGPVVYIWIVFGCIFAGAVHDYMSGLLSMRQDGASIPDIDGKFLGMNMTYVIRILSIFLLIMCGVVFTTGPADLLALLTPEKLNSEFWLLMITIYYFFATLFPIDKFIGKLYPVFGILMLIMAVGVSFSLLFSGDFEMPELWNSFSNQHPSGTHVWPFMCITVACGAISGFHSTQTPIMARCLKYEKDGRKVFYGAMIAEGILAMIWAAAGVSVYESGQELLAAGGGCSAVVYAICKSTMGKIGAILGLIGVIVCPISSGDTAFRSARLIVSEWARLPQTKITLRLLVSGSLLFAGTIISHLDYSIVWRYFSWSNQILAMISLWAFSIYLKQEEKNYLITLLPAIFMASITTTYFFVAPECLGAVFGLLHVPQNIYYPAGVALGLTAALVMIFMYMKKVNKTAL